MYAENKGWPLDDVRVTLSHERTHAEDCEECETKEGKLDVLRRHLEFVGDLQENQRARLAEIATRCPVHRTLEGSIEIIDEA